MIWILLLLQVISAAPAWSAQKDNMRWLAAMDGTLMVPPTDSPGQAELYCEYNDDHWTSTRDCVFTVSYRDLSSPTTGAYLMRGRAGEVGIVAYPIFTEHFSNEAAILRTLETSDVFAMDDSLFVIITTDSFPAGEVRGQFVDSSLPAVRRVSWSAVRALYR